MNDATQLNSNAVEGSHRKPIWGLLSILIALLSALFFAIEILLYFIVGLKAPDTLFFIILWHFFLGPIIYLIGLVLAIIGCFSKQRRGFAIIGIILNFIFGLINLAFILLLQTASLVVKP